MILNSFLNLAVELCQDQVIYNSLSQKHHSCLSSRSTYLHPSHSQIRHFLNPLLNQLSVWHLTHIRAKVIIVVIQNKPVNIDLGNTSRNTILQRLRREAIGTVKRKMNPPTSLLTNLFEPSN